jgi:succinyl-CoA:acetate CoA-transferase
MSHERIHHAGLLAKLASAEQAAALIQPGETVAMSGFTGSGYPKAVPLALARASSRPMPPASRSR